MSWASSASVRRSMRANKRRDTSIEVAVRRQIYARGLRYRVDFPPIAGLPRRADIAFPSLRLAIFIDGCFWHRCELHFREPRTNVEYWGPKIDANVVRDADTTKKLEDAGWVVQRYWEHEAAIDIAIRVAVEVAALRHRRKALLVSAAARES